MNTGGNWNAAEKGVYFLASTLSNVRLIEAPNILVPLNLVTNDDHVQLLGELSESRKVLLDSGVHALVASEHRRTGLPVGEIFIRDPFLMEDFEAWIDRYTNVVRAIGDKLWGYVEIDLGGPVGKRKIRGILEERGLKPIPVYHPLVDDYEYFDELHEKYDRICIGNIANNPAKTRQELILTLKKRNTKKRFLHLLGLTPSEIVWATGFDSSDSSTWIGGSRWGFHQEMSCLKVVTRITEGLVPNSGSEFGEKATALAAKLQVLNMKNYSGYQRWLEKERLA